MNKSHLMGRLTRDPDIRYTQSNSAQEQTCIARYSLAVNRRFNRDGEQKADFISCVAFGQPGRVYRKISAQRNKDCSHRPHSDRKLYQP